LSDAVAKTCPSCGYSSIGPFTDNCPICAEPVRNVRSDTPGFPRPSLPPWLWWLLGGVATVVVGVVGCCGFGTWLLGMAVKQSGQAMERAWAEAEADRRARTVLVAAADLLREFENNPAAAHQKYKGKTVEVTGIVERTGVDGGDTAFVVLHAGDERAKLKIECFFDAADEDEPAIKRLGKGRTITVRGAYDGRVSHVQVRECVLVKDR
jgi:hypothetical protein